MPSLSAWTLNAPATSAEELLSDRLAVGRQLDLNVAARGVGVRADAVRRPHERDRLVGVLHRRQRHVELDAEDERALLGGDQADLRVDRHVVDHEALASGGDHERALEARRVADGEELLGVRAAAVAAELGRGAQLDLEQAIAGATVPVLAAARDMRASGVEGLPCHHRTLPSGARHRPSVDRPGTLRKRSEGAPFTPACDACSTRLSGAATSTSVPPAASPSSRRARSSPSTTTATSWSTWSARTAGGRPCSCT